MCKTEYWLIQIFSNTSSCTKQNWIQNVAETPKKQRWQHAKFSEHERFIKVFYWQNIAVYTIKKWILTRKETPSRLKHPRSIYFFADFLPFLLSTFSSTSWGLTFLSLGRSDESFGKNFPTLFWYSAYSGYFPAVMSSVNHVEAWKRKMYDMAPKKVQLYITSLDQQLHWYKTTQMVCSAAKFGWRDQDQRPETVNPRSRSSASYEHPLGTLAVSWYCRFASW